MILRTTGADIAEQAFTGGYIGKPYSKYDCQGFVEAVLKDLGVRKPDGTVYNWKGSNSMYRNYIRWRGTIEECKKKFGCIPLGAFMFKVKNDGGEVDRGYNDGLGNASHVGLYIDTDDAILPCMDSQVSRGVDFCNLSVFTHVGLMDMVDYSTSPEPENKDVLSAVHTLRDDTSTDEEFLKALEILTKHMKGV